MESFERSRADRAASAESSDFSDPLCEWLSCYADAGIVEGKRLVERVVSQDDSRRRRGNLIRRRRASVIMGERRSIRDVQRSIGEELYPLMRAVYITFSSQDFQWLKEALQDRESERGPLEYIADRHDSVLRLAWPVGWCVRVDADLCRDEAFSRRMNEEYLCCRCNLVPVGRVLDEMNVEQFVLLVSLDNGSVFCYAGEPKDTVYRVAAGVDEFVSRGLQTVDTIYSGIVYNDIRTYRRYREWITSFEKRGVPGLMRFLIRRHGCLFPIAHPENWVLRVCGLECFSRNRDTGRFWKAIVTTLRKRMVPIGIAVRKSTFHLTLSRGIQPSDVPIFITEQGYVLAYDTSLNTCVRLADNLPGFVGLGLTYFYRNDRHARDGKRSYFDRAPGCPSFPACGTVSDKLRG
uniref:GP24 n=1 Tax=Caviid herpesvirus 2 str. CIDMTR TaxID=1415526 RepID=U6H8A5_9BETA|nr:GP24 [Caviid herpesvirus 2 str. CIDMTR]